MKIDQRTLGLLEASHLEQGHGEGKTDPVVPAVFDAGAIGLQGDIVVPHASPKFRQLEPKGLVFRIAGELFLEVGFGLAEFTAGVEDPGVFLEKRGGSGRKRTLNHQDTKTPRKDKKHLQFP